MTTLESVRTQIAGIVQDASYSNTHLTQRINEAVLHIAGGIRTLDGASPYGPLSPSLPDLMTVSTVTTSADAFQVALPADYQRGVFYVAGPDGCRIPPPPTGDYYDYIAFLNRVPKKDLSETGRVYAVCVRGKKLYYQGKTEAELSIHYYRKPEAMADDADEPDGLPYHLSARLIKHYVCREIFGEGIEDGETSTAKGYAYHASRFWEAMTELINFVGVTGEAFNHPGDEDLRANPWNI